MKIHIKSIKLNVIWKVVLTLGVLLFGTLLSYNTMDLANKIQIKILVPAIYAIFLFCSTKWKSKHIDIGISSAFIIFCFFICISSMVRGDYLNVVAGILCAIAFCLISSTNFIDVDRYYGILCFAMVLSTIMVIWRYDISSLNSQGIIIAFTGIILLNWFCIKRNVTQLIWAICVLLIVMLIGITRSRTSMGTFLLVAAISYVFLYMRKVTIRNLLVLLIGLFVLGASAQELMSYFTTLFFNKWQNADITSNRLSIWGRVLQNISVFGNGTEHLGKGAVFVNDAHNVVFQILGCFGVLALLAFFALLIVVIKKIIKIQNKIVYINFFVGWCIISLFENLEIFTSRLSTITVLLFIHICMLAKEKEG